MLNGSDAVFFCLLKSSNDLLRPGDVVLCGCEHVIGGVDLVGMNAELALEPESARPFAGAAPSIVFFDVEKDRVDGRLQTTETGGQHHFRAHRQQHLFVQIPFQTQVTGVIPRAEGKTFDPGWRLRNVAQGIRTLGGLDNGHEIDGTRLQITIPLQVGQQPVDGL